MLGRYRRLVASLEERPVRRGLLFTESRHSARPELGYRRALITDHSGRMFELSR